jgi:hypothetical protein
MPVSARVSAVSATVRLCSPRPLVMVTLAGKPGGQDPVGAGGQRLHPLQPRASFASGVTRAMSNPGRSRRRRRGAPRGRVRASSMRTTSNPLGGLELERRIGGGENLHGPTVSGSRRLRPGMQPPTLTYVTVTYASSSKGRDREAPGSAKPILRGWLHLGMAPVMQVACLALIVVTPTLPGRLGIAIYLARGHPAVRHLGGLSPRDAGRPAARPSCAAWITRTSSSSSPATYTPLALLPCWTPATPPCCSP